MFSCYHTDAPHADSSVLHSKHGFVCFHLLVSGSIIFDVVACVPSMHLSCRCLRLLVIIVLNAFVEVLISFTIFLFLYYRSRRRISGLIRDRLLTSPSSSTWTTHPVVPQKADGDVAVVVVAAAVAVVPVVHQVVAAATMPPRDARGVQVAATTSVTTTSQLWVRDLVPMRRCISISPSDWLCWMQRTLYLFFTCGIPSLFLPRVECVSTSYTSN